MDKNFVYDTQLNIDGTILEIILDCNFAVDKTDNITQSDSFHTHSFFEFFFVEENALTIVTEQGSFCYKNTIAVVPPQLSHFSILGEHTFRFSVKFEARQAKTSLVQNFFDALSTPQVHQIRKNEETLLYLQKLGEAWNNREWLKVEPLLTLILLNTMHAAPAQKPAAGHTNYVFEIDRILAESFERNLTLADVAGRLFLSEKQTSRIIRKSYGCTLSQLVTEKRLSVAAMLLRSTEKPVAQIAAAIGFSTESYFFVLFKAKFGMTPSAYRKAQPQNL